METSSFRTLWQHAWIVSFIPLTKFHCLKYTITVGKKLIIYTETDFEELLQKHNLFFLHLFYNFFSQLSFKFFLQIFLLGKHFCIQKSETLHQIHDQNSKTVGNDSATKVFSPSLISFLPLNTQKFDPNITGLYIKFPIFPRSKNMYLCNYLNIPAKKYWL